MVILILNLKYLVIYSPSLNTYIQKKISVYFAKLSTYCHCSVFLCERCVCASISARASGPCLCHFCEAYSAPSIWRKKCSLSAYLALMDMWGQSFKEYTSSYNWSLYASNTEHANMCSAVHSSCVIWLEQIPKFPSSHSQFFFFKHVLASE